MYSYFYLLLIPILLFSQARPLTNHLYQFSQKIFILYLDVIFTKEFLIAQRSVCPWSEDLQICDYQGDHLMIIDEKDQPISRLWNMPSMEWSVSSFGLGNQFSFKPHSDGVYFNASLHGVSAYGAVRIYLSKSGRIRFEEIKEN